jgi:hypothetical protein
LEEERDELRQQMSAALDAWQTLHAMLQENAANRAIARGSASQSPSLFADAIKVGTVRDGNVVFVAEVLAELRGLAEPQKPNDQAVENLEQGAEPTRHVPPAQQPHFSGGGEVQIGPRRDPEQVQAWVDASYAEGRVERQERAASRRQEREARREAEDEAIAQTRP